MPIYMRIEGIEGESHSEQHRDWIDIYSFSWGLTQHTNTTGGGGGAGKASFSDLSVMMPSGKGSPKLFLTCASGKHLPAVQMEITRFHEDREEVLQKVNLTDCLITSFADAGDGGSAPVENMSLNFTKIEFIQNYFAGDGSVRTERAFWDVKKNQGG